MLGLKCLLGQLNKGFVVVLERVSGRCTKSVLELFFNLFDGQRLVLFISKYGLRSQKLLFLLLESHVHEQIDS